MKKGISLIVLVITIIVMIILAASVVITLSNTNIINKSTQVVELNNEKQVQDLATIVWMDAYMDDLRDEALSEKVISKLEEQGVKTEKWDITVTNSSVIVSNVKNRKGLGSQITAENYGETVDYSVIVDGTVYDEWRIYYHNNDYVYLISSNSVDVDEDLGHSTTNGNRVLISELTTDELAMYDIFRVESGKKLELSEVPSNIINSYSWSGVGYLIRHYAVFANYTDYGSNVIGAIGGPTLELLTAGWNAKGYTPLLTPTPVSNKWGYFINNEFSLTVEADGLYIPTNGFCWLTTTLGNTNTGIWRAGAGKISSSTSSNDKNDYGIYPVVCLKATIPAKIGTNTNFSLIK